MTSNSYQHRDEHLPFHHASIQAVEFMSTAGTVVVLVVTIALFTDLTLRLNLSKQIFGQAIVNLPTIIALLISGASILLYKKNKNFQYLGLVPLIIGVITVVGYFMDIGLLTFLSAINAKTGMFLTIIGFSFLLSIIHIHHRYHYMQAAVLIALSISLFGFLEGMHRFLSLGKSGPLWDYLLFFILCQSILFSRPDRGFVGLFTTDSRTSALARMSFFYFTFVPPILGVMLQIQEKLNFLDASGRLALMAVLVTVVSLLVTWINIHLLYSTEVENFLLRETLREHNIKLELDATDLSSRVKQLEETKKEMSDKLNNQQSLREILDDS